jgi:hypothetical protein
MQFRHIARAALLLAVGCGSKAQEASQAAAAKSAEEAEIDKRCTVVAQALIEKAAEAADQKREAAERQKLDARTQMRQATVDRPESFLDSNKMQMVDEGKRHLTSISLTNKSKFSMSDIRGTVDYHGDPGAQGDHGDVVARVPVELTGAIAPGASMVFSEQQRTLSGASIQLPTKAPSIVTFTVTHVTVGSEGIDSTPAPAAADAGVPGGGAP